MKQRLKALIISITLVSFVAVSYGTAYSQPPSENQKAAADLISDKQLLALSSAPDFSIKDLEGNPVTSAALKGKIVLLHFWATWCHFCRKEIPPLNELYKEYGKQGVIFLAVSLDRGGPSAVRALMKRIKINYQVAMGDNNISKAFGNIRGLPTTFIINQKWQIYRQHRGYVPKNVIEESIKELLDNQS